MTTITIAAQLSPVADDIEFVDCTWCGEPVLVSDETEIFVDCDGPGHMHGECQADHDRTCTNRGCWPEEEPLDDWDR